MSFSARQAGPGDIGYVEAVTRAAYAEYDAILDAPPLPVTEDYAPRVARGEVFVVVGPDGPAGAVTVESHPDHLMIFSLAVSPDHRGRGIGRWMLAFAEACARGAGLAEVRLYTNAKMLRNIAIYERAGYRETGRRDNPFRAGWVLVDMVKALQAPAG